MYASPYYSYFNQCFYGLPSLYWLNIINLIHTKSYYVKIRSADILKFSKAKDGKVRSRQYKQGPLVRNMVKYLIYSV